MLRRSVAWLALTFVWSWSVAGLFVVSGRPVEGYWSLALAVPFLVGPLVASLLWKRFVVHEPLSSLDTTVAFNGAVVLAWIGPALVVWASLGLVHLLGWGSVDVTGGAVVTRMEVLRGAEVAAQARSQIQEGGAPYLVLQTINALIVGLFYYSPLAFAEEIGWRGVLLRELRPLGFWPAAVLIGLAWGVWHLPLVLLGGYFPDAPVQGALVLVGASIPLGALLAWLREAGGTVWAAAVAHGVLTAFGSFYELVLPAGEPQLVGVMGVAGGIVLLGIALALFLRFPSGPTRPVLRDPTAG
jgi:membrane protease YdiL (CAAX protease family)